MVMKRIFVALSGAAMASLVIIAAYAANPEPVTVEVTFVVPIDIVENNSLRFGLVDTGFGNGDTVTVGTDGTVSDSGGGAFSVGGTTGAAELSVTAAASTPILIVADNATGTSDYSVDTFVCNYNGTGDAACGGGGYATTSAAAATATLLVGATINGTGAGATAGTQNSSFDVTITYQ